VRVATLVIMVLLSGCVTELLAPPHVTARTMACSTLALDQNVVIAHHVAPASPMATATIDAASVAWMTAIAEIGEKSVDKFSIEYNIARMAVDDLPTWHDKQEFLRGSTTTLHILWLPHGLEDAASSPLPGTVVINVTMIREKVDAGGDLDGVTAALLFHGLGHALGTVNMGIPLHDSAGPTRESSPGHESSRSSILSTMWHNPATFPSDYPRYPSYSEGTVKDWQSARAGRVCA
jgi:hypothetical protein